MTEPRFEEDTAEFTSLDGSATIEIKLDENGNLEVHYYDYMTVITDHTMHHWTDQGRLYTAGLTFIEPREYQPSVPDKGVTQLPEAN